VAGAPVSVGNEPGFTTPQTQPVQSTPATAGPKPIDYSGDAWLQKFMTGFNADESTDATNTLDAQKKLLLGFGSKELARKLLGANDPFIDTISDDPANSFSVLANLRRRYDTTVANTNQLLNKGNLFFGGYRGKELGRLGTENLGEITEQTATAQSGFDQLASGLLQRQSGRRKDKDAAEFAAWQRAVEESQKSGAAPPTGGGGEEQASQPVAPVAAPTSAAAVAGPAYGPPDPWMVALGLAPPESARKPGGSGSRQFMAM
jgi:hypothetical protein